MRSTSGNVAIPFPVAGDRPARDASVSNRFSLFILSGRFLLYWGLLKAVVLLLGVASPMREAQAQQFRPHELIVSDPMTGAAILGFDPVAYFIDRRAKAGDTRTQANHGGKVWHFASEANRSAFVAHPEAYAPMLGGHDPVAAASGIPVSGNPRIHVIRDGRLYLFRSDENRTRFESEPAIAIAAERLWPEVKRGLAP